ncbi:hypothetical protein OHA84_38360 (plasmid) [Streptomyces sp. NBC_00513]|uniref:hypothetical protein n=1 Tax=unclassified Streptomyces TaxID=2593676 RepID=UPI00225B5F1D|nr:hypothetical protein [Streptomyces sp. NBC_00424]MCX5079209.1 hypothetical protein [Streptomyces sp. NBC_00424]WUD46395.1 hypothetical protein OHA84_38360 [Streptomyces sp. NBC_00513]
MTATLTPRAGTIDDIRHEEEDRGYERDETDSLHQVGTLLLTMAERDDARIPEGRRARRTLAEMAPGYIRPPLLRFNMPVRAAADEACALCGYWTCRCGQNATASSPPPSTTGLVR